MTSQERSNSRPESNFGRQLEFGLVSLFSLVAIVAYFVVYGPWRKHYPGRPIEFYAALPVLTVTVFAALSLGSRIVVDFWRTAIDRRAWLAWLYPLTVWAFYSVGTIVAGHANPRQIVGLAVYLAVPVGLALIRRLWADWLIIFAAWLPIQFQWLYLPNLPVPGAHDQIQVHPLFAACVGFWAIMVVRRLEGFDFRLLFGLEDLKLGLKVFAAFSVVMLPLGMLSGFADPARAFTVHNDFHVPAWAAYPLLPIGMYFGVALIEEAQFRGLLQNMLGKSLKQEWVALVLASLVFGIVHFKPPAHANVVWHVEYALFAAIAGGCYGFAYKRTGRIMPGAVAHALINSLWLTLFNPPIYGR